MQLPGRLPIPDPVLDIARRLEEAGFEAWCVGGALRDALLGQPNADFDIATSATPDRVRKLFRRTVPVGIEFGTVGVLDPAGRLHEVTTFRRDVSTDGRRAVVAFGASLEDDLARRDFTINAIAYHPIRHDWRDPFGGADDIDAQVVRAVGPPPDRFREDYLRILRCFRFAARFGFTIEAGTWQAALGAVDGLPALSAERVRDEWFKSLATARSLAELAGFWWDSGAAGRVLPELLEPGERAGLHALQGDLAEVRDPVVLTALLCHHPAAVLQRLRCSAAEIRRGAALEAGPAAPAGPDEVAVRRWLSRVGAVAGDLAELARLRGGQYPAWWAVARQVLARGDPITRRDLAVTGQDLLAAGLPAGPRIGALLERLLDAVLADPSRNTRETLLALAKEQV